ncbi:rhodanese-like domain-containing protein [Xylella taiwanensis]|uniref:Rhodanese-like domain-containing protein n=1 Tax=Xylella taiwanensis TaxID=1444770 RepID=Z9JJR0_9GAMM|nr:rhodanese-like domain-containing protein [Xylella taiwanensis]AXI83478.1 hypothetical protein AB672_05795 [Xylella taiwanensis]EWS77987.1 sulfurtransferase [Xylella taiwanensis]MCD8456552.1 rhodanese-like domain-containing protein [Xylella taiwanensis]MCD8458959.1 rhodanese-like domain-containing protein [Xylella taiwanensis]MCD8461097.1 rhodanese-like domain-containing protein [Xylella taiwanensis]
MTVDNLVATARSPIHEIKVAALATMQVSKDTPIDVRQPAKHLEEHLPNALNIPSSVLEFRIHSILDPIPALASRPLVLYRTVLAAESLQQSRITGGRLLAGGILPWRGKAGGVVHKEEES